MKPIDLAYMHCWWAKRAGYTPHAVIRSVGGVALNCDRVTWLDAVSAIEAAAKLGKHLPNADWRAAA